MYKQKNEIIEQIQSYHRQVANLYSELYDRVVDKEMKSLIHDLYEHEKSREKYLEKHKKIAVAMNSWLNFPSDELSKQITNCFKNINTGTNLTMEDLIKIEMHFDNCLIKLYNILASESELSETIINVFHYMLKKTKKEESALTLMFHHSKNNLQQKFSAPKI